MKCHLTYFGVCAKQYDQRQGILFTVKNKANEKGIESVKWIQCTHLAGKCEVKL
jgi:hypothetical protein